MQKLLEYFQNYTLEDIILAEEYDSQFQVLRKAFPSIDEKAFVVWIVTNAIICYQLSSSGESYWQEIAEFLKNFYPKNSSHILTSEKIISDFLTFLPKSTGNKRLVNMKTKRLQKFQAFLDIFLENPEYFYNNQDEFLQTLCKIMKQKISDKTIVFTLKMFLYAGRINYWYTKLADKKYPIPIDSRLTKIYLTHNTKKSLKIERFYELLCKKLWFPAIHFDAILWMKADELVELGEFPSLRWERG